MADKATARYRVLQYRVSKWGHQKRWNLYFDRLDEAVDWARRHSSTDNTEVTVFDREDGERVLFRKRGADILLDMMA